MSSKSTVTPGPMSPEQKQFYSQQLELGQQQLDFVKQQAAQQQDYLTSIKPAMDAQTQLWQQALQQAQAQNTPEAQAAAQQQAQAQIDAQNRANDLLTQQLQGQQALAPLQQKVLEAQLQQALQGNNPTPEQIAAIDAATKAAQESGMSDINAASETQLRQLRDTLAPSLGSRPTDTPILDRGALVATEATRQAGQLASSLAAANANARLNYPLASAQVSQAASG